jgi:arylsulfatase A-like enzyme
MSGRPDGTEPAGTTAPRNVLLVTVDSLRADAVGFNDSERHTPVLDSLAGGGAVFERAFATGNWTPFSFPSILSSRPVFADDGRIGVTESPTLADALSGAGIETGGFNAANGFLTDHWGYDRGFDAFESFLTGDGDGRLSRFLAAHPTVEAWLQLGAAPFRRVGERLRGGDDDRPFLDTARGLDVERAAGEFVESASEPFFLWVHYMDAHTPYAPAPRYVREVSDSKIGTGRMLRAHTRTGLGLRVGKRTLGDLRTLYQGGVRQVDASVGRLLKRMESAGVREETAVLVAGDHGEEFQDHGHLAHYPKLYDELIHVPFIASGPGIEPRRVREPVGLDAIPPTVAGLLGADAPEAWTGENLAGTLSGRERPDGEPVVSVAVRGPEVTAQPIPRGLDEGDLLVSARDGEWTYIENTATGERELYHRETDPAQSRNLAADPDRDAERALTRLAPLVADHAGALETGSGPEAEMDEDLETRLAALGYR